MVKAVLEHNDSILSYGTEDLAQFKDLPQTTTKIGMLFFTSLDLYLTYVGQRSLTVIMIISNHH